MNGVHLFFIFVTVVIGVMLLTLVIYNLHRYIEKQDQEVDELLRQGYLRVGMTDEVAK